VENIAATLSGINARIEARLEQLGFPLPDAAHRCPHMFGALLSQTHTGKLVGDLMERNIYISQRGNALRFSPHLHVNDHDVQRLIDSLDQLVS